MVPFLLAWIQLKTDCRAVTALEYGLIGAVVVAVIAVGFTVLAGSASTKFVYVGNHL
jgi:Flp pilus assembly pilin Flp